VHGFLDTIREGHTTTRLLVISPLWCPIHEDTPGPTVPDFSNLSAGKLQFRAAGDPAERAAGKLTLNVIRPQRTRSPNDGSFSVRRECTDRLLIFSHAICGQSSRSTQITSRASSTSVLGPATTHSPTRAGLDQRQRHQSTGHDSSAV
jgi:hypothetical protein